MSLTDSQTDSLGEAKPVVGEGATGVAKAEDVGVAEGAAGDSWDVQGDGEAPRSLGEGSTLAAADATLARPMTAFTAARPRADADLAEGGGSFGICS